MKPCGRLVPPHLATFIYISAAVSNQATIDQRQGHTQTHNPKATLALTEGVWGWPSSSRSLFEENL